jgi:3-isopropylmalate/(R)-2-methylmalate dehydratase small subunit
MMRTIRSRVAPLLVDHVDTDQIIPARFLKTVSREGLGARLFADWREDPEFVLGRPAVAGARILLSGVNFGCGSSREHAAWALAGAGFEAVIAASFADIFRQNALRNGLLPVEPPRASFEQLVGRIRRDPEVEVEVDLAEQRVRFADGEFSFPIDPFARDCLLQGIDPFTYLLDHLPEIEAFEAGHG